MKKVFMFLVCALFLAMPFVSAGVGISWDKESSMVPEKTKTCLTYKVYNPWDNDVYSKIVLSEELQDIISSAESEAKFIPAHTSSKEAIPVTFCFKTPSIYEKDCLIGDFLICKQDCTEDMKVFRGQVEVIEMSEEEAKLGASQGSKTTMSVSAPLTVRVQCIKHDRNWSAVYVLVALVAGIWLAFNVVKSRKPKKKSKKKSSKKK